MANCNPILIGCESIKKPQRKSPAIKSPRRLWLEANKSFSGDECLIWPFPVGDKGRGLIYCPRVKAQISAPKAMCRAAHGEAPSAQHHAAHSCGNGHIGCMNPRHLRWATRSENEQDKVAHGTLRKGSAINTSKLGIEQAMEVKRRARGGESGVALALEFGITPAAVSAIKTGKNWGWLD